jgi:hypothetical protein
MHCTRHRMRARTFALLLAVAGCLTAAGATSAQAAPPEFKITGTTLVGLEAVQALQEGTYKFEIPNLKVLFSCTELSTESGNIKEGGTGEGTLAFNTCTTFLSGSKSVLCEIQNQPVQVKYKSKLILHNSRTYVLFEPPGGGVYTTLKFEGGCSIAETSISGTVVGRCLAGAEPLGWCEEERVKHLIEANEETEVLFQETGLPGDSLRFGARFAKFSGSALTELSGGSIGEPWSAIG